MKTHKLAQMTTLLDCVTPVLSNSILFFFITKQNTYIKIAVSDTRVIFTKTKVKSFIKSFDKTLSKKSIDTIYNGQIKK